MAGNRMAIIGLGIMGRRMLANALAHPRFDISGLWDPSALSVARARELMPGAPVASDAAAAMAGAVIVFGMRRVFKSAATEAARIAKRIISAAGAFICAPSCPADR